MNYLKIGSLLFLSFILIYKVQAQYDSGTIIYTENVVPSDPFDDPIIKKYIVVDFDGDYYFDIIKINEGNPSQLTWFKGDENGNFSIQNNMLSVDDKHKENEIFYEDMNGDLIKDIIFQNSDTGFVILLNDGQGNITTQLNNEVITNNSMGTYLKEIADVDGDGDMDGIFWIKEFDENCFEITGNCSIGYNNGDGTFSDYSNLDNNAQAMFLFVEAIDIEGDGDLDIMCSGLNNYNCFDYSPFVWFYENTGLNSFTKNVVESSWASHIQNVKIIDIDTDGSQELLVEYFQPIFICHTEFCYTNEMRILDYDVENKEFTILKLYDSWLHNYLPNESSLNTPEIFENGFQMQFKDQNKDGNTDILSINALQGRLQWHLGDGNGNFDNTEVVTISNEFSGSLPVLKVVDVDYDTDLDIFVQLNNGFENTLIVYKNIALSPVCSPVLNLGNTLLTTGIYQAGTTTISSGRVVEDNNITLKAGNNVNLEIGFQAPLNSTVKVEIDSCN